MIDVLSGLMENDITKMLEFNEFFKHIEKIHRKKVRLYVNSNVLAYNVCA